MLIEVEHQKELYPITLNFETSREREWFKDFMYSEEFRKAHMDFLKRVVGMKNR